MSSDVEVQAIPQGRTAQFRPVRLPSSTRAAKCCHIPRKAGVRIEDGVSRATCRRCECDLIRTQASRKWYRSGMFG